MYVLTRRYLHQDAGKTYSEISNTGCIQKQPSAGMRMKKNTVD